MPLFQTKYTADPSPLVVGDTLFLYTSHDASPEDISDENEEGRVFLIQQLWSILAGVVTPERLPKVLHAIDVDLYDPMGTLVMAPGYSRIDTTIGYIGTKAPGIHENGGIYLHTLAWKLAAEAVLKRNDRLYQTLQLREPCRMMRCLDGIALLHGHILILRHQLLSIFLVEAVP